ncbi:MAG: cobalt-precorrin-5B (C(1))-methyltransferase CbiD [Pseudomonadota bacterium]
MARATGKRLKSGFTTGTAAAAAFKAALALALDGTAPESVRIDFLSEGHVVIPVHRHGKTGDGRVFATVIKDAGDDPDVTHQAEIGVRLRLRADGTDPAITIASGEGVGTVTKPGLGLGIGAPAVNPGPRKMLAIVLAEISATAGRTLAADVEIFVPRGAELAGHTLNARLGILGGISILGTTGIVRPLSHEAYVATVRAALGVTAAMGQRRVVLTTGRRTERFAQMRWPGLAPEAVVQIGDYFEQSLALTAAAGIAEAVLAVMFGKALKMAQGKAHTHAAKAALGLDRLGRWTVEKTGDAALGARIGAANTAREAFDILRIDAPVMLAGVGKRMVAAGRAFAGPTVRVSGILFDYDGHPVWESEEIR